MKQAMNPMTRFRLSCAVLLTAFAAILPNAGYAQDEAAAAGEPAASIETETTVVAEEQAPAPAAAVEAAEPEGDKSLWDLFQAGGWAMWPLLALSIMGFALVIYNTLAIRPDRFLVPAVTPEVDAALRNLDVDTARTICEENPAAVTNIIRAGLSRTDIEHFDPTPVKEAIEESAAAELSDPFVAINYLSMVGTLSPMLGLLGTVTGMIKGFAGIASEGMGNPQLLADAISECLITTAAGMIIAIPAMFFYFYFKNRYGKITSQISRIVGDMVFNLGKTINRKNAGSRA